MRFKLQGAAVVAFVLAIVIGGSGPSAFARGAVGIRSAIPSRSGVERQLAGDHRITPTAAHLNDVAQDQQAYSLTVSAPDFAATKAIYSEFLAQAESSGIVTVASPSPNATSIALASRTCFTITKPWATALAWTAIALGGVAVVVGIVAAATGAGLILTAVLGAVGYAAGESGNLLLSKVQAGRWPEQVCA